MLFTASANKSRLSIVMHRPQNDFVKKLKKTRKAARRLARRWSLEGRLCVLSVNPIEI